jgi:hypothetical protein
MESIAADPVTSCWLEIERSPETSDHPFPRTVESARSKESARVVAPGTGVGVAVRVVVGVRVFVAVGVFVGVLVGVAVRELEGVRVGVP